MGKKYYTRQQAPSLNVNNKHLTLRSTTFSKPKVPVAIFRKRLCIFLAYMTQTAWLLKVALYFSDFSQSMIT